MPKFKAVLFDLDNTLLDFMELKKRSCEAAVLAMIDAGLDVSKEEGLKSMFQLYDKYGIEDHTIFQKFLQQINNEISYPILSAGIVAYRNVRNSYLVPFPHVHQTLSELKKKGIILGIITDAPKLNAWIRLAAMRLTHYFTEVITFDDTNMQKPSLLPFKKMLELLKLNPEDCLMIGDWEERDMLGASGIGIKTCFARYGSINKQAKADYIIDDVQQLLLIVE